MRLTAQSASLEEIAPWRDMYRQEMSCQIIHDSLHVRPGWTLEYLLRSGDTPAGYGSVAVSGPWKGKPTVFEFYVMPQFRVKGFDLFNVLLSFSHATAIETQSNDPLLTVMLHTFARNIECESILFHDKLTTTHLPMGAAFRSVLSEDAARLAQHQLDADAGWVVTVDGAVAAAGGILFHYNRPYGDIYMKVAEPFRRRGIGSFLVQELKRVAYERGNIPAARCNVSNVASRKTLQRAGFVPCGNLLAGRVLENLRPS